MAVDYRKQYSPEQLTPFWPNEIIRLTVAALCTLAVMTVLAVLPVILDHWGLGHWIEESEPANPRATPAHIRPEWYFLAVYQQLKLAPQEFCGVDGKTIGVLSQAVLLLAVILLPFWVRRPLRRPTGEPVPHPPGRLHGLFVTLAVAAFVVFTLWAVWPPPNLMIIMFAAVIVLFYLLLARERRKIRRVLRGRRGSLG